LESTDNGQWNRRIAVIGAGPGGLCMAIQLKRAGFDDFVVFEKAHGVGGTWWHNRYPGAACDVPSHLYSYSFEPKPDWSRSYADQPEIQAYFEACVEKYALAPHLRLGAAVKSAAWDDERCVWRLATAAGEVLEVDILISALGMFNELHWPDIPGLDEFRGTKFHSARWDREHDLSGETVGVIGSAASAVQFVPEIAKRVGQIHLYQRTANWVLPKEDEPFSAEQIERLRTDPEAMRKLRSEIFETLDAVITFSNSELLRNADAAGRQALSVVKDHELRHKLTPTHPYGCKRPLLSNFYYETFNRDNVELVTEPIERISADSIVSVDGVARRVDTIVLSTGFATTMYLSALEVSGRGGRKLDESWNDGAQAHLGIATSGFPNLFMLYGPNTNNGSIIYMIECQVDCIVRQIERMAQEGIDWVDVRPDVMQRYNEEIQRDIEGVEVWQADCLGYYRTPSGRIVTQWPHTMAEYRRRTEQLDLEAFAVQRSR